MCQVGEATQFGGYLARQRRVVADVQLLQVGQVTQFGGYLARQPATVQIQLL